MSGYSGTPLWKKLGMKPGSRWVVVRAPEGFAIEGRPDEAPGAVAANGAVDGLLAFCLDERDVKSAFDVAEKHLKRDGGVWIAWPKKASSIKSELDFDFVQGEGLGRGLVDNKCCAVDDDWSGLRFVVRTADRKSWPR
jgi:hypothetical protein